MTDDQLRIEKLTEELRAARLTIGELRARLDGDALNAQSWLQQKAHAQRKALRLLNRRIVNQRLMLRTINETGRGLTREEWATVRATLPENVALEETAEFAAPALV